MKITHIPKDKLIKIRYESKDEKDGALFKTRMLAEWFEIEVEELKQTR